MARFRLIGRSIFFQVVDTWWTTPPPRKRRNELFQHPPPPPFPSANLNEHFNDARDVKATIVAKSDRRARFEPRCTEADNG